MSFIITTQRVPNEVEVIYFLVMANGKSSYPTANSVTQTNTGLVFMGTQEEAEVRARETADGLKGCVFVPNGGSVYTVKQLKDGFFAARVLKVVDGKISPTGQSQTKTETFAVAAEQARRLAASKENRFFVPGYYTSAQ